MGEYDPFDWAASATGYDTPQRPLAAEILNGWSPNRPQTSAILNWLYALVGRLAGTAGRYETLEEATAAMSEGDTGVVMEEADGSVQPGSVTQSRFEVGLDYLDVDVTGEGVYAIGGSNGVVRRDRDLGDTPTTAYVITGTGTPARVQADGRYVVLAYGNFVECWDLAGTSLWRYTHGAQVNDIAIDGTHCYLVGVTNGSETVAAIPLASSGTSPTVTWTYNHGATLQSVAVGGGRVILGGAAGTGSYTLRALDATTGAALWSSTPTALTKNRCLATDGKVIVAGLPVAAAHQLVVYGAEDGQVALSRQVLDLSGAAVGVRCVALDHALIVAGFTDGGASAEQGALRAYDRQTLAQAWKSSKNGATSGNPMGVVGVASDGQAVFATTWFNGHGAGSTNWFRVARGGGPYRVARADITQNYLPARMLVIPAP